MKASELIGKKAIRTAPTKSGDYSYMTKPLLIMKVTDSHVLYKHVTDYDKKLFGEEIRILDDRWLDGWTDYDELVKID